MADATDSKSVARKGVWVQVPPPVLFLPRKRRLLSGRRPRNQGMIQTAGLYRESAALRCSACVRDQIRAVTSNVDPELISRRDIQFVSHHRNPTTPRRVLQRLVQRWSGYSRMSAPGLREPLQATHRVPRPLRRNVVRRGASVTIPNLASFRKRRTDLGRQRLGTGRMQCIPALPVSERPPAMPRSPPPRRRRVQAVPQSLREGRMDGIGPLPWPGSTQEQGVRSYDPP
jgi:hypothetical protein